MEQMSSNAKRGKSPAAKGGRSGSGGGGGNGSGSGSATKARSPAPARAKATAAGNAAAVGQKRKRAPSADGAKKPAASAGAATASASSSASKGRGKKGDASTAAAGATDTLPAGFADVKAPKRNDGTGATSTEATTKDKALLRMDMNSIGNAQKRNAMYRQQKEAKNKLRHKERTKRQKVVEALGADAPAVRAQRTLENTREHDETVVNADANTDDQEVVEDEKTDEYATYFDASVHPKIILTTSYKPSKIMYDFLRDLMHVIPNSFYYERKTFEIKEMIESANAKGFTDLIIVNEDRKKLNALTLIHLPNGPTAHFKLSSVVLSRDIPERAAMSSHKPEVILNRFTTRLGHRVGRMLAALFHQDPNFKGRRACTFHNQRDFIFFRHHRYDFDATTKQPRIQECGPQFTLKLRWLQSGTFDTKHGNYEFMAKPEHDTTRRKFHL